MPSPGTLLASEPLARQLVQRYTLEAPIGLPFLPALDRPEQVDGLAADADSATGMLAATPGVPATYRVVSLVPPGTIGQLSPAGGLAAGAEVPGGSALAYTTLPVGSASDVAAAVRFAAILTQRPAVPSLSFLQSFFAALHAQERRVTGAGTSTRGYSVPAGLGGTSLAQVMNAVTVDRSATPEQFATFFAVVARYLGVPVRVVTGFRVPAADSTPGLLPAGSYQLTNRDAWTWDEVPVLGYGWVAVDPTPVRTTADVTPPPEQVTASPPTVPSRSRPCPVAAPPTPSPSPSTSSWPILSTSIGGSWSAPACPRHWSWPCLVGGPGVPALRRYLRRRARHQPTTLCCSPPEPGSS